MLVIIELLYNTMIVKKPSIAKPISQLGVKSLQVYCLSIALLSFWLPKLYGKFCSLLESNIFATNRFFYSFVFTPVLAISYAVLLYYIVILLEKTKASKVIFGR